MTAATGKHRRAGGALQALRRQRAIGPVAHREALPSSAALALLVALERGAPALTGLMLLGRGPYHAAATAVGAVGLSLLRVGIEQHARLRFQAKFLGEVARVIATRSAVAEASEDRIQSSSFGAIHAAASLAVSRVPTLVGDLLAATIMAPLMVWSMDRWMVAAVGPCLVVASVVAWVLRRATTDANERTWDSSRSLVDGIATLVRGRLELVAQGRAGQMIERLESTAQSWSRSMVHSERMAGLAGRAPVAVLVASVGLVAWLWMKDSPSAWTGTAARALMLGTGLAIAGSIARTVAEFGRIPHELLTFTAVAELRRDPSSPPRPSPFSLHAPIVFDSVHFSYEASREILHGVSFRWEEGELLAIEGPNGSGKSTLLRLVARLVDPSAGSVTLGGTDLRRIELLAWRGSLAFLPQRPFLPERGTVFDGLRWIGSGEPDDARAVLEELGLMGELEARCPSDPYSVRIADLSMGERQKVALARVLASKAPVVMLDEPDSWLDARAVEALGRLLRAQRSGRKILMIAHDPRLLGQADRVIRLGRPTVLHLIANA